ncbi:hypothetical protein [Streptomyces sp. CT34]|uniref:hypothetical protein n=1 Tax=Streptomyces sp. CT34 TaxID=1553907 RepID=UPI0005BB1C56|nr:hypothetical protein [Streptomyces sp. CT34]
MAADKFEERAAENIALYTEGLSVERLRERFEISAWALYGLLGRHRVPLRGTARRNSASGEAVAEFERLRADGMTHDEIAEKFGIKPAMSRGPDAGRDRAGSWPARNGPIGPLFLEVRPVVAA